jgi:hypothetical protein
MSQQRSKERPTPRERQPDRRKDDDDERARQEAMLDEALMETFPASDPIAIMRFS